MVLKRCNIHIAKKILTHFFTGVLLIYSQAIFADKVYTLKFATLMPAGTTWTKTFDDWIKDIEEKSNLRDKYPEKVKELTALLQSYVDAGRSTPGEKQQNDGPTPITTNK